MRCPIFFLLDKMPHKRAGFTQFRILKRSNIRVEYLRLLFEQTTQGIESHFNRLVDIQDSFGDLSGVNDKHAR